MKKHFFLAILIWALICLLPTVATGSELLSDNFDDGVLSGSWTVTGNTVQEADGVLKVLQNTTDAGGVLTSTPFKLPASLLTLTRKTKLHYANNYSMPSINLAYRDVLNNEEHVFSIYYGNLSYNGSGHIPVYGTFLALGSSNPHWGESRRMTVEGPSVLWDSWFDERITYDRATGEVQYFRNGVKEIIGIAPILPAETSVYLKINSWGWFTGHSHYVDDLTINSDTESPAPPPPVVFFPGIAGSRLYTKSLFGLTDNTLWIPNDLEEDVCKLKPNGVEFFSKEIYTKAFEQGLIEEATALGVNVYKDFITKLEELEDSQVIKEWVAFPYDWRRDVRDIANYIDGAYHTGIIYGNNGTVEEHIDLVGKIIGLKERLGPVTIIGHSNGGLLAKAVVNELADRFGEENVKNYIGRVILVAVPQLGTPEGLLAMLHGKFAEDLGYVSENAKREAAETMPGALGLLPSKEFFNKVDGELIKFVTNNKYSNDLLNQLIAAYGNSINHTDFNKYTDFLRGINSVNKTQFRQEPHGGDCEITPSDSYLTPNVFSNNYAFEKSITTHNILDHWTPPPGVKVEQIVGQGLATTMRVEYYPTKNEINHRKINSTVGGGDGTVLPVSAAALNVPTYWVNLRVGEGKTHFNLMEDIAIHDTIESILVYGSNGNIGNIRNGRVTLTPDNGIYLTSRWTMKSPVDLQIYDDQGNHTGIIRKDGQPYPISNIPGSTIDRVSGHQVITLQGDRSYNVILDGVDNGTFTLEVETFNGDSLVKEDLFSTLPSATQTKGSISMNSEMVLSQLELDYNGDGQVDSTIDPYAPGTKVFSNSLIALGDYIRTLGLAKGTQQALLSNIKTALTAKNTEEVKGILGALSNKLRAMSGKKQLSSEIEAILQGMIREIQDIL